MRIVRIAALAVAALASLALGAPSAVSGQPHQVDQSTLQPPLNPDFTWSCYESGKGITCKGSYESSFNEPIGLLCDGQEVWVQGSSREFMTRWHTADGLATKTVVHLDYPGDMFSFTEDGSGPTVTLRAHWNRHYDYPDPGVRETRVLTEVGAIYMANERGRGITFHDAGKVVFEPGADFEEVEVMRGIHDFYSDPALIDQFLCDALTRS